MICMVLETAHILIKAIPIAYPKRSLHEEYQTIVQEEKTRNTFLNCYKLSHTNPHHYMLLILFYHNIYSWMISSFRKLTSLALSMQTRPFYCFADNWKDRDEASEKVFISQSEKETLKRLLKKVENDKEEQESNLEEFERKLSQIMRRYKIENVALAAEIQQLHKNLK